MNFERYYEKFEKMQRWIREDLKRSAVLARANFLVAMGIFNYIEILGSFCIIKGKNADRFKYVFENLLPIEYKKIFNKLGKITKGGAYNCLRCGLTHEYLVKTYVVKNSKIELDFVVYGTDDEIAYITNIISKKCGIELFSLRNNKYYLRIYNPKLIYDLDQAFENYKKILFKDKIKKKFFLKRCKDIHLEKFG